MICRLLNFDYSRWWQLRFDHTSVSEFYPYEHGSIMLRFNDTSHLRQSPENS
jgi:broad specificity phosphatase PhoE